MELITVIVPIYKSEKYLDRCIKSIVEQSYGNLEIILVDDGSTDESPKICDYWSNLDSRIKVIHQKNSGVSMARNVGVSNAHGNYIMMVDSDDYIYSGMIEKMYITMTKCDADMVICDFEKGNLDKFDFPFLDIDKIEIIDAKTALSRIYDSDKSALQYVAPWGKLYKKELFQGIVYPVGKIFEDIYITHQLLYRCNKLVVLPEKMVYYYQHSESIMNQKFHVGKLDYLEALKNRLEFYKNNKLEDLAQIAYDEYLHSLIWEYSRARDLLGNKKATDTIIEKYRCVYIKGYSSKRYLKENKFFLRVFALNPEWIVFYWKISAKIKKQRV